MAVMDMKKQYCECPLCDNAEEAGCTSEGTVLVGETWMCPDCVNNVAATRGLRVAATIDDVLGENRTVADAELAEAESKAAGLCAAASISFDDHQRELAEADIQLRSRGDCHRSVINGRRSCLEDRTSRRLSFRVCQTLTDFDRFSVHIEHKG